MRNVRIFFLATAMLFVGSAHISHASCDANSAEAIKDLDQKIGALRKVYNQTIGKGPQIEVGTCAFRLKKLFGPTELCCKDFSSLAATAEEMACLELKKQQIKKQCQCSAAGGYSTDEALQDEVLELVATAKKLRSTAIKHGIKNPVVQAIVKDVSAANDCIQIGSVDLLRKAIKKLEELIAKNGATE